MKKIRKAVIPVAGLGTRFLPATKSMAKEIIPVMDKPAVQFVVEEALAAGIEEILVITGRHKRSVEDHFDANIELEENLEAKGKDELLAMVQDSTLENIQFKRQHYPKGLGDAVALAESFVGEEPFLLMLSDNILVSEEPASQTLMAAYNKTGKSSVLVQEIDKEMTQLYGILDPDQEAEDGMLPARNVVEKPQDQAPSQYAICGRYVLDQSIFRALEGQEVNPLSGEIELSDALSQIAQDQGVNGLIFNGEWYEVGEPLGMVKASIQYALRHKQTGPEFKDYLKNEIIPKLKGERERG
ncbi:UTP--glucose-1-phosphate uridylyltransferase [Aerococcus sp. UMB10185]|uniref:UTP--glucose-1-phosphate uridylyltransferase n=1 Tax=unclassified Aerococcus TaxID=2618060 RepID=UPI00254F18FA|nr:MULTISPECIES: UTP--glucose-1-phosphate uridylyltransferase [unclassified Aerococcus]MDK6234179.1 UTP--glucose-1-phosphate uridylyltransferase [Aerococcus sp. UMB10185]MDK6856229.1 UTP--glucose-1-phosphate uridylyltransferase [Aerococcus sp. UMB7533]